MLHTVTSTVYRAKDLKRVQAKNAEANAAMIAEANTFARQLKAFEQKLDAFEKAASNLLENGKIIIAGADPRTFSMKGAQLAQSGTGPDDVKRATIADKQETFPALLDTKVHQPISAYYGELKRVTANYTELEKRHAHWGERARKLADGERMLEKFTGDKSGSEKVESKRHLLVSKVELKTKRLADAEAAYNQLEPTVHEDLKSLIQKARALRGSVLDAFSIPGELLESVGMLRSSASEEITAHVPPASKGVDPEKPMPQPVVPPMNTGGTAPMPSSAGPMSPPSAGPPAAPPVMPAGPPPSSF